MINPGQVATVRHQTQRERREADERLGQLAAKWTKIIRRKKA
jgi:hypothetical protein